MMCEGLYDMKEKEKRLHKVGLTGLDYNFGSFDGSYLCFSIQLI